MENCQKILKMWILVDSGGSPENCQKRDKMTKIDHFGGPSENCQQKCPREAQNSQNLSKYCPQENFFTIFLQNMDQKRGGGLRPPPPLFSLIFWDRLFFRFSSSYQTVRPRYLSKSTRTTIEKLCLRFARGCSVSTC